MILQDIRLNLAKKIKKFFKPTIDKLIKLL